MQRKLLFAIYSIYGGGAEKQMQELLRRLERNNCEIHLALFSITGKEKEVVPADVVVHDLSTRWRPSSLFLTMNMAGLLNELRPDTVISFLWSVNLIVLGARALSRRPVRAIVSERTFLSSGVQRYRFAGLRKWLLKSLYPKADAVVAVSQKVAEDLREQFLIPGGLITVIKNGADIEEIRNRMNEEPSFSMDSPYILSAGGLNTTKNFPLLIEAFSFITAAHPALKLVILGSGSERDALTAIIRKHALQNKVVMPGAVSNPYAYMRRAGMFVLPSRFEGLPNVLIEAMCCETPVIATNCRSGITEIVADGKTGLLCKDNDAADLASKISLLLGNKDLRGRLTEAALRSVRETFAMPLMIERYRKLIYERDH